MDTLNSRRLPVRQQGFVLVLALVIMVVITLSAVAMIATLRGGVSASGNVAFRQAATRAADVAVESGFQWISTQLTASASSLNSNSASATGNGSRYYATFLGLDSFDSGCAKDSTATVFTPQNYRFNTLDAAGLPIPVNGSDGLPCAGTLGSSPSGYGLFYVIHRMAQTVGTNCPGAGCATPSIAPASGASPGCSFDASSPLYCGVTSTVNNLAYYRVTVKVVGPRQNTRYIQTLVY